MSNEGASVQVEAAAAAPGGHDSSIREFEGTAGGSRRARRFVEDTCRSWGVPELVDEAALVVTELSTNAVKHACSPFVVAITPTAAGLRIAVTDASTSPPILRTPDVLDTGGRGLGLVAAVASRWGVDLVHEGKVVWAELT